MANSGCNMGTNMTAVVNKACWRDGHITLSPVQISPNLTMNGR